MMDHIDMLLQKRRAVPEMRSNLVHQIISQVAQSDGVHHHGADVSHMSFCAAFSRLFLLPYPPISLSVIVVCGIMLGGVLSMHQGESDNAQAIAAYYFDTHTENEKSLLQEIL